MAATLLREISQDERERAKLRSQRMAETDRVSDLITAHRRGKIESDAEWQGVVADMKADMAAKNAEIADKDMLIARLQAELEKRA